MANIAVIGLGEAGSVYASALAKGGHGVWGIDPGTVDTPVGVSRATDIPVEEIDIVLVLTSARVAGALGFSTLSNLKAGTIWVDLSTASPTQKAESARVNPQVHYVDIAILGPVVLHGILTPLLASGAAADRVAKILNAVGAPVEVVAGGVAGDAMAHKLLRSILMKGLAAVVTEAVTAGAAAGREDWIRTQIAAQLAGSGTAVVDRFLTGSVKHAARRADEMSSVVTYLTDLGVSSEMSAAAGTQLTRLSRAG